MVQIQEVDDTASGASEIVKKSIATIKYRQDRRKGEEVVGGHIRSNLEGNAISGRAEVNGKKITWGK